MDETHDDAPYKRLEAIVRQADLHYVRTPHRYHAGHVFDLEITGVLPATTGRARLEVEAFGGGGFAGQVYRARLVELDLAGQPIPGLEPGTAYALKLLVPPSRFALAFRNAVYWLAYQGPFAAQVNSAAARTGVLWQKIVRRAAMTRFGADQCVADTYATFFDEGLGSYGEINEWVEGRNWKFEIDEQIFKRGKRLPGEAAHSQEYLAKKGFMAGFVRLLHDVGAPELARQYEWWTCKSQPNVLKRNEAGDGPADGLTAIDFRAGLALLPLLPMSPADIALIIKGLGRGALVQFDRGDLEKLGAFCDKHKDAFEELAPAIEELKQADPAYRSSLPDVTHHGFGLVYKGDLRRSVKTGLVEGWRVRRYVDAEHAGRLRASFFGFWLFWLAGFIPVLGRFARRLWGNAAFARHVRGCFSSFDYLRRTWRASMAACLIDWRREDRATDDDVERYLTHPFLYLRVRFLPGLLPMPSKWHRFLTNWHFARQTLKNAVAYPIRFYRDAEFRVQWLTNEVETGAKEGMLTPEEKEHILERVPDPFIQKYLKCVAVHICTLPVTQVVSLMLAVWAYVFLGESWRESITYAVGILILFQVVPISPGSIVRGTYVVYLIIKERNVRNYWLAALVSYWKYIGYLGFPLQMVKEFPVLSRFMAGRWATKMVSIIPVFGERGALLEHLIFDLFFNVPLSIKRRFSRAP
ncbi:MAG TPA: hypothetical protein HPP77_10635 [Candidatus Hydrogenedentes bacterium]|nr:hypothetical protein [Candidatus Hydrogenedentota bacterium]